MKRNIFVFFVIIVSGTILFSCSKTIEQKLEGTWKVSDVTIESSGQMDPALAESSKESAKLISYELLDSNVAKIRSGSTVLEGSWIYKADKSSVYMIFSGTYDTILMGKYMDGKLINEEDRPDIKITTIFIKEKK